MTILPKPECFHRHDLICWGWGQRLAQRYRLVRSRFRTAADDAKTHPLSTTPKSLSLKKTFQYLWWFLALVWEVFVPFCLGRTWNSPPFPLIINSTSPHSHSNGYVGHTSPGHEWNGNPGLSRPAYSITRPHHIISSGLGTWPNPDQLGLCVLWNWQEKNETCYIPLDQWFSTRGNSAPTLQGHLAMSEVIFGCYYWRVRDATGNSASWWRPGRLRNFLWCRRDGLHRKEFSGLKRQ